MGDHPGDPAPGAAGRGADGDGERVHAAVLVRPARQPRRRRRAQERAARQVSVINCLLPV
jgi:hypothetical protein